MSITNNCEDIRSLPVEQSHFLHATAHEVKIYTIPKAYKNKRGTLQVFSSSYGHLSKHQAHVACKKLARVGNTKTVHEQLEEEFEVMQGLINGLKREL